MSSKPKKPAEIQASEGEKIQTQLAKDQIAHYRDTYAPLESRFADEATRDYSSRLSAQAGSAAMREATGGLKSLATSTAPVNTADIASGVTAGRLAGLEQGLADRNSNQLQALGVGLGITADASQSLTQAGRMQTNSAIESVQAKIQKQQAQDSLKAAGFASLGTLGSAYGTYKFMNAKAGTK